MHEGGNAIQTVQSSDAKKVITVRAASFAAAADGSATAPVEAVAAAPQGGSSIFKGEEFAKSDRPEPASAKIIISGGRALGSAEAFEGHRAGRRSAGRGHGRLARRGRCLLRAE